MNQEWLQQLSLLNDDLPIPLSNFFVLKNGEKMENNCSEKWKTLLFSSTYFWEIVINLENSSKDIIILHLNAYLYTHTLFVP